MLVVSRGAVRWRAGCVRRLATGAAQHVVDVQHDGPVEKRGFGQKSEAEKKETTLKELQHRAKPVVSVERESQLKDVVHAMANQSAATVFVQDSGMVVGAIRETDVVRHAAETAGDFGVSVQDVMATDISYASLSSTLLETLFLLDEKKQDHMPILQSSVDEDRGAQVQVSQVRMPDVTSIISAKQVIGQFYLENVGPHHDLEDEVRLKREHEAQVHYNLPCVKGIIKAKKERSKADGKLGMIVLNTLVEDEITVAETIQQMSKFKKGSVAVMEMCRDVPVLVGIATERDIIRRAFAAGVDIEQTLVADIMTDSNLATVTTKDSLLACAHKMIEMNVRHLPVVSTKGEHVLAMISASDVIAYLVASFKESKI